MSDPQRLRRDLDEIVRAAIDGVEPGRLVVRALAMDPEAAGSGGVRVLCAGKGAAAMAAGAARALGRRILSGLIVSPEAGDAAPPFETMAGGHPLPTVESQRAGPRPPALAATLRPAGPF